MPSFPGCRTCANNDSYSQLFGDPDHDVSFFDTRLSIVQSGFGNDLIGDSTLTDVQAITQDIDLFFG